MASSQPVPQTKRSSRPTVPRYHPISAWLGSSYSRWTSLAFSFALLVLAAGVAALQQFELHPVYGSIPAHLHHRNATIQAAVLAAILACFVPPDRSSLAKILQMLPIHVSSIPVLSHYLRQRSGSLGPEWGPVVQDLLTSLPLFSLTLYVVTFVVLFADERNERHGLGRKILLVALSSGVFTIIEQTLEAWLPTIFGSSYTLTRSGLQPMLALGYFFLLPSKFLYLVLPALYFSFQINPQTALPATTSRLNPALLAQGFALLERTESLTGYISVLEDRKNQFRVLRCDHSLLGGEWLVTPERARQGVVQPEPVYSIFTMLEAVRLMQARESHHDSSASDRKHPVKSALTIGLGIGTCQKALAQHGIETLAIEIDPAVSTYATKYFGLPGNVSIINEDAVHFTREAQQKPQRFDYIVHDVFTGGAEPIPLFTLEFVQSLKNLLKDHGSIAINYAADLRAHSTAVVLYTVISAFGNCKVFRDHERSEEVDADFANIVLFCKKDDTSWEFRPALEADYLNSQARREFLVPKHEVDVDQLCAGLGEADVLRSGNTAMLESTQARSAIDHWRIMRQVLPDAVWELW